jgi:type IV secretion system protein VirD4
MAKEASTMADRSSRQPGRSAGAPLAAAAAIAVIAFLVVRWLARQSPVVLAGLAIGVAVIVLAGRAARPARHLPRNRVRNMRLRARLRLRPGPGHATVFELWLRWGRLAAARRARRSRRSLTRPQRLFRAELTSVLVGRAQHGHALRVPVEEHVIWVGPPRSGKTGPLASIIAGYPGPVVVTSTRGDLHELTARARADRGPVYVLNPQRLAGIPSTMRWDLLAGCEDPATAIRRAEPLAGIAAFKGEGEEFWSAAVTLWLQTLMHVAALHGGTMDLVHYWSVARAPEDFFHAIAAAGGEAERWGALVRDQMMSSASRTTDTIRYMLAGNLAFMLDRRLREAVTPGPGAFSPARFAAGGGTLYLIAESRDDRPAPVAGVFAALVTEIYHQAALAAATMPGGRLDPPMLWALDEVTQTCPVPGLPSLLADAGGRGVQIMPVVHGPAQLRTRWGQDGARAILDTCGTKVFLPGLSDPQTLEMASRLSGTTAGRERGQEHDTRHPVMTEDMIRELPVRRDGTGYALIIRNGLAPVIGRPPVIWHSRRHKRLLRRQAGDERALASVTGPGGAPGGGPGQETAGQAAAAATAPMPAITREAGHARQAHDGHHAPQQHHGRPSRAVRAWDRIGGQS